MEQVRIHGIYRHYKGNYYLVEDIATHSETLEKMVVYRALYGDTSLWVRPLSMFTEPVERKDQPHRFELQTVPDVRPEKS